MMQKPIITLLCAAGMIFSTTAFAQKLHIKKNAPARYVVRQGDSLWGISGKYLARPWQWPALWGANRKQIHNPNLIYPGQTLVLYYVNGHPRLRVARGRRSNGGIPTVKLHPRIRDIGSGYAIPSINVNFYRMFMKTPQFVTDVDLAKAGRIVAGPDNRLYYAPGDRIYADGIPDSGTYLVFRLKHDLIDPVTKAKYGKLVEFAGEVSTLASPNSRLSYRTAEEAEKVHNSDEYITKDGWRNRTVRTAQPMMVTAALSEIHQGDYLIKKPAYLEQFSFMPHEPAIKVNADILEIMDGIEESGAMQTLILNKGTADGIDNGTVLSIYRRGKVVHSDWKDGDPKSKRTNYVNTPNQEIGLAMVYRTGEHVSSAIILESISNVSRDDLLSMPGQDVDTFGEPRNTIMQAK